MKIQVQMGLVATVTFMAVIATAAEGKRHHHSHAHGLGEFNVVVEGSTLTVELKSPAMDIVGFETAPKSEKQKAKAKAALNDLKVTDKVISLPAAAACALKDSDIHGRVFEGVEGGAVDGKDHQHKNEDGHSDVHATWTFECQKPDQLKGAKQALTSTFRTLKRLKTSVVNGSQQSSADLTSKKSEIPGL